MNIYMDDWRVCPIYTHNADNWVCVRLVEDVKTLLQLGVVVRLSLDHDMGDTQDTGYDLCHWMVKTGHFPTGEITVHSANQVGAENMKCLLDNAKKHGLY